VRWADVVTTTTHKTLRGPRGALVLCKREFADYVNKGCPLVLGGPLANMMAAKAVALTEAAGEEFRAYARAVRDNARALAAALVREGLCVQSGGTDNHLLLVNAAETHGLTGRQGEAAMSECGITLNRNSVPFDPNGPWWTSGLRIGTPALTTRGLTAADFDEVADLIVTTLQHTTPEGASKAKFNTAAGIADQVRRRAADLVAPHPLYPGLDLG